MMVGLVLISGCSKDSVKPVVVTNTGFSCSSENAGSELWDCSASINSIAERPALNSQTNVDKKEDVKKSRLYNVKMEKNKDTVKDIAKDKTKEHVKENSKENHKVNKEEKIESDKSKMLEKKGIAEAAIAANKNASASKKTTQNNMAKHVEMNTVKTPMQKVVKPIDVYKKGSSSVSHMFISPSIESALYDDNVDFEDQIVESAKNAPYDVALMRDLNKAKEKVTKQLETAQRQDVTPRKYVSERVPGKKYPSVDMSASQCKSVVDESSYYIQFSSVKKANRIDALLSELKSVETNVVRTYVNGQSLYTVISMPYSSLRDAKLDLANIDKLGKGYWIRSGKSLRELEKKSWMQDISKQGCL